MEKNCGKDSGRGAGAWLGGFFEAYSVEKIFEKLESEMQALGK
jgi:hypothetical protein